MLEPVFVEIGSGSVAAIEDIELRGRFGEFVVEEVPRGQALTVVEVPCFAMPPKLPAASPDMADQGVDERIDRRAGVLGCRVGN